METANRSFALTTAAILTALAAGAYLSQFVILPLHEDIVFVTQVTRNLISDGNLKNAGICYPFQVLRSNFQSTDPFFAPYVLSVFYFWPFFKLLGSTDFAFFIGQALLLLLLGKTLAKSEMGWRWAILTISAGVLTGTLVGSICFSPTQLLAICFMAYFWLRAESDSPPLTVWDDLLLGAVFFLRPEALFMGVLSVIRNVFKFSETKKRIRFLAVTAGTALLSIGAISWLRRVLGAASDPDCMSYLLLANVLAPGFRTLGLAYVPPATSVLHDPVIFRGFCQKVLLNLQMTFSSKTILRDRRDWELLILPLFPIALRKSRSGYYFPAYALLIFQVIVSAVLLPLPRHFDAAVFFVLWALIRDLKRVDDWTASRFNSLFQKGILLASIIALAIPLSSMAEGIRGSLRVRADLLDASQQAHRCVPQEAFVITDMPELWLWYGRGKMCCFVPFYHPDTMRLMLTKFPQAYLVMFLGSGRAGFPMEPFGRPLLNSLHHVKIYGPASDTLLPEHSMIK
jgi:hypothetical protein